MFDIIVDIDGTIADNGHRTHFLRQDPKDWDSYHAGVMQDGTHDDVLFTIRALLRAGCRAVLCTGRGEEEREDTLEWLVKHGIYFFSDLYMRKEGDRRPDYIIKTELYEQMLEDGYQPRMVFEDRNSVVKMWREKGLRVMHVEDGDF